MEGSRRARRRTASTPNAFTPIEFAPVKTMAMRVEVTMAPTATVALAEWRVGPDPTLAPPADLHVDQTFALDGDALAWTITLANSGARPVEIGDLAVPFNFAERAGARGDIYTRKLLRHSLRRPATARGCTGSAATATGPYLVHDPDGSAKFEYYDSSTGAFTPYIHAKAASAAAIAAGGNWRLPVSSLTLAPKGSTGASVDLHVPVSLGEGLRRRPRRALSPTASSTRTSSPAWWCRRICRRCSRSARRTRSPAIDAEHPASTKIELVVDEARRHRRSIARASRTSARTCSRSATAADQWTSLEFFVTEPLETVIQKRAAFLVSHHQHTRPVEVVRTASTATGIRRTRSSAAPRIATTCRRG